MESERQPLLGRRSTRTKVTTVSQRPQSETAVDQKQQAVVEYDDTNKNAVGFRRHITLTGAIGIIVGNVIGSGIFISTKGVYENIGSVGGCLVVWGSMGIYALMQALCYAELGAVMPCAGGDYAYVYYILGVLPAFLCVWVQLVLAATATNGVIAQTAGIYLMQPLGRQCIYSLQSCIAILIIVTFAAVNIASSKLATRVQMLFSTAKVIALCIIIATGTAMLCKGQTDSFKNGFEGTTTDPGRIALSTLDGYFAYKGWDLPLSVVISLLLVTIIYVMTNVAYFTALTPVELLQSDAVALTFMMRTLGGPASLVICVGVALSCMGTVNGSFLSDTRYLFAAGRTRQVPQLFAMIHFKFLTPVAAVILVCVISIVYSLIPSVEQLQQFASLAVQLKILTGLAALIYLRCTRPKLHRPLKIPMVVILLVVVVMVTLMSLSVYKNPTTIGVGVGIFLFGIPIHYLIKGLRRFQCTDHVIARITVAAQQTLLVVPEAAQPPTPITGKVPLSPGTKPTAAISTS